MSCRLEEDEVHFGAMWSGGDKTFPNLVPRYSSLAVILWVSPNQTKQTDCVLFKQLNIQVRIDIEAGFKCVFSVLLR